jgi:hypothetical protein
MVRLVQYLKFIARYSTVINKGSQIPRNSREVKEVELINLVLRCYDFHRRADLLDDSACAI